MSTAKRDLEFYKAFRFNRKKLHEYLAQNLMTREEVMLKIKRISRLTKTPISILLGKLFGKKDSNRIFQFPTVGLIRKIMATIKRCKPKIILEIGAGNGLMAYVLSQELKKLGENAPKLIATDNFGYGFDVQKLYYPVKKLSFEAAIKKYASKEKDILLLSFWPSYGLHNSLSIPQKFHVPNILITSNFSFNDLNSVRYKHEKIKLEPIRYKKRTTSSKSDFLSVWDFVLHPYTTKEKNRNNFKDMEYHTKLHLFT
jgi:hypothetical protein